MQQTQNFSLIQPKKTYYVLRPLNMTKNTPSGFAVIKKFVQDAAKRGELSYYRLPDYHIAAQNKVKNALYDEIQTNGFSIKNKMLFGWNFVEVKKHAIIPHQSKVVNIIYFINGGEIHPLELDGICNSFQNVEQINLIIFVGLDYKQRPFSDFDRNKQRDILLNKTISGELSNILKIPYIYICQDGGITVDEELIELELDRLEKKAISREYKKFKSYFIKTKWNFHSHDLVVTHKNMLEENINFLDLPPYYYKH